MLTFETAPFFYERAVYEYTCVIITVGFHTHCGNTIVKFQTLTSVAC
jgi:hypothetical protein